MRGAVTRFAARDPGPVARVAGFMAHLRANGFPHAERRTLSGAKDRGDINAAAEMEDLGFDQWFRALVKRPGQEELRLLDDVGLRSYVRYVTLPESVRPLLRNYTVRERRGDELVAVSEERSQKALMKVLTALKK